MLTEQQQANIDAPNQIQVTGPGAEPVIPTTEPAVVLDPPIVATQPSTQSSAEVDEVVVPSPAVAETHPHQPTEPIVKRKNRDKVPGYNAPTVISPQDRMAMADEPHLTGVQYDRIKTEELKWLLERERGPESEVGWWSYICLCGPRPGPQPDPNEEWPGRKKKSHKRHHKKDKHRARKPRAKRDAAPLEEKKEVLEFRSQAVKALEASPKGFTTDTGLVLARAMGFIPSLADIEKLRSQEPLNQAKFDQWIQSVSHTEDQDKESLVAPFKVVDYSNKGTVSEFAFTEILSNFGENLDAKESMTALADTEAKTGAKVNYQGFVDNLLALNRKVDPAASLAGLGIDAAALPPNTVTEVTHFAPYPYSESDSSYYTSSDDDEGYTPVTSCPSVSTPSRPSRAAAEFWSRFM